MGNVWQWTDEYVDAHTRMAIVRGGSHYLLMAPGLDRSGAIGFRCVRDAVN